MKNSTGLLGLLIVGGVGFWYLSKDEKNNEATDNNKDWESLANNAQGQVEELRNETDSLRLYISNIENEFASSNTLSQELIAQLRAKILAANLDLDDLNLELEDALLNQDDGLTPYSEQEMNLLQDLADEADRLKELAEVSLEEVRQMNDELTTSLESKQSQLDTALSNQDDGLTPYSESDINALELEYNISLEEKENTINDLGLDIQNNNYTIDSLRDEVDELDINVADKIQKISELENSNENFDLEITELKITLEDLTTSLESKESELNTALLNQDDGLTPYSVADFDELELEYNESLQTKQNQLTELQGDMLATLLEVEGLEFNLENRDSQIEVLNSTLSNVRGDLVLANDSVLDAQDDLEDAEIELEEAENDLSILDSEYDLLVIEVAELKTEVENLGQDKFQLETSVSDLEALLEIYNNDTVIENNIGNTI